jgi:hypothetical protein
MSVGPWIDGGKSNVEDQYSVQIRSMKNDNTQILSLGVRHDLALSVTDMVY